MSTSRKMEFCQRAPPTRGASLIAWDEPISSDSGKNMVAALKKDWKLWSDGREHKSESCSRAGFCILTKLSCL